MPLNGMFCNVHIDPVDDAEYDFGDVANYDFVDDAGFDFNALPAGCPSGSTSGSSYASSSFGPHTPTSGQSTPPFSTSFDFGSSSFASSVDSDQFGLTPPSSATSTYFPMTPVAESVVSDFVNPVFPVTPSRGQFEFPSHPLSSCGPQLTPPQNMDCNFLINQLGPLPVLSTPSAIAQINRFSDVASHWAYPDSPISFELHHSTAALAGSFQPIKQEPDEDRMASSILSSHTTARRRALLSEARRRTTVLQQEVQKGSPNIKRTTRIKREKKARAVVPEEDHSYGVDSIEAASAFKCLAEGCPRVYRRNEHMKRHMKT